MGGTEGVDKVARVKSGKGERVHEVVKRVSVEDRVEE